MNPWYPSRPGGASVDHFILRLPYLAAIYSTHHTTRNPVSKLDPKPHIWRPGSWCQIKADVQLNRSHPSNIKAGYLCCPSRSMRSDVRIVGSYASRPCPRHPCRPSHQINVGLEIISSYAFQMLFRHLRCSSRTMTTTARIFVSITALMVSSHPWCSSCSRCPSHSIELKIYMIGWSQSTCWQTIEAAHHPWWIPVTGWFDHMPSEISRTISRFNHGRWNRMSI